MDKNENPFRELAESFCAWPLPDHVCSDPCASMVGYPHRSGTNLLTLAQAEEMLRHVLGDPTAEETIERVAAALAKGHGADWFEPCAYELGKDECDSSTCVAACDEDHDAELMREHFRSQARIAITAIYQRPRLS